MRDYDTIVADLAKVKQAYHDSVDTLPAPKLREMTAKIEALQKELQDALTRDAIPCPTCKQKPHGMQRPVVVNRQVMYTHEIGCLTCKPKVEQSPDDPDLINITEPRTMGMTAEAAVKAWNAGVRVQKTERKG